MNKRTCGGAVGQRSLISKWLKNRSAEEVLSLEPEVFLNAYPTKSKTWQYILLKHFLAVQSGLAILLGREPGGVTDYCTAEAVEYGPDGMTFTAQVRVDVMSDRIEACRSCCWMKQSVSR
ncbi:MAG: hypothetical protein ACE5K8_00480 [Candidatus Zixiibacteriota bacterium]